MLIFHPNMDRVGFGRVFQILIFFSLFFPNKVISNFHNSSSSNALCIEMERDALLKFKKELEDPSNRLSSWIPAIDCCKWHGIRCDSLTGHVQKLQLANLYSYERYSNEEDWISYETSKLKGNLSDSILHLKHLSYIDLSYNNFEGIKIPSFLGSLVNLNYLNLTEAGFQGMIPHQLGNLSNLQRLILRGNFKLYSENLQWVQGLHSLRSLDLSCANLSKVSDWLLDVNELPFLKELHLSMCELNQISHVSHVNFTTLSLLDISKNNFDTFIPQWILTLGSLVSLDLSENGFEGTLPRGLSNLTSLQNLNVGGNGLNSSLPKSLFDLTSLTSLVLSANCFEGSIPCAIQNLSALLYLDLSSTLFNSTSIPSCLYSLHTLQHLDLSALNLKGEISNDIANLTNLVSLDLSMNKLEGNIPRSIGSLCNLRYVDLSQNKLDFFEIIPEGCLANNLIELDLSINNISGYFTNHIAKMKNLIHLDLRVNNISGYFTNHIAKMKNLQSLDISQNFISGPIPESIGNLFSLIYLDLSGNNIYGPIPQRIGNLTSLKALFLQGNKLNGNLPKNIGLLSSLQQLRISQNCLEGIVSDVHFANLTSLKILDLSDNDLTLSFSIGWIPPFNLYKINLRSNLGPQFPKWLKLQKNFASVDLSDAKIVGTVPDWFWSTLSTSCYSLNLSNNQLSSELPDFHFCTSSLLGSNKFYGNLPRISSNVEMLDLSNNVFSENMSHFLCYSRNHKLQVLLLENNLLSGNIPDCWKNWKSLTDVTLSNNILSGKLPSSIGSLNNLQTLHLRNNSLFGKIPRSLANCHELQILDLSLNAFEGNIPRWIGLNLSSLLVLELRSNQLSGLIPNELCQLSSLQIMDIGNNNVVGSIPLCFGNFTAMATKRSIEGLEFGLFGLFGIDRYFVVNAYVVTKGKEVIYGRILSLMTSIDLSNNNLFGEIPHEITNLFGLISLNLSGNNLNGSIPQQIGSMTNIESLDFSRNQLSGQIPQGISMWTFVSHLNLSYNNLSGQIPSSTQIQGLDNSSFIGNELCGLPLTNSCQRGEKTSNKEDGEAKLEEDDENYIDQWFYLSVAIGFVVGFWGIWGPLLISRPWRHKYFTFLNSICNKFN